MDFFPKPHFELATCNVCTTYEMEIQNLVEYNSTNRLALNQINILRSLCDFYTQSR